MPRGIYDRSKAKRKGKPGRPKGSKNKSVWAQVPEVIATKPTMLQRNHKYRVEVVIFEHELLSFIKRMSEGKSGQFKIVYDGYLTDE